jgi:hypothetical protein
MKTKLALLFAVALCVAAPVMVTQTGCTATQQVITVRTLETVGLASKAALDTSAIRYNHSQITAAQWQEISDFYLLKFQPAFNFAVAAVKADQTQLAPADVQKLADQFAALVASYQPKP